MFKFVVKRNSKELFHRAVAEDDIVRVKLLLDQSKDDPKFNLDEINEEGLTALQNSCFIGNIDMVKLLVASGANMKIKDRDGWTLLHAAVMAGKLDIVRFLVENGLNVCSQNDRKEMPIDFAEDKAILMYLVKKMLEAGVIEEVQKYIKRNPKQKKEIYKQIEQSIQAKRDEIKTLESFPFTPRVKKEKKQKNPGGNQKIQNDTHKNAHQTHAQGFQAERVTHGAKMKRQNTGGELFTLDVDNLPESPSPKNKPKKWSSASDIPGTSSTNLTESRVHMHNGYETDGTERRLCHVSVGDIKSAQFEFNNQASSNKRADHFENDIASVNSHSTSGYETDDNLYVRHAKPITFSDDTELALGMENNNQVGDEYFQRSKTMSPRTVRRLEHRFGALVVNDTSLDIGNNKTEKKGGRQLRTVEYPEVFL